MQSGVEASQMYGFAELKEAVLADTG